MTVRMIRPDLPHLHDRFVIVGGNIGAFTFQPDYNTPGLKIITWSWWNLTDDGWIDDLWVISRFSPTFVPGHSTATWGSIQDVQWTPEWDVISDQWSTEAGYGEFHAR